MSFKLGKVPKGSRFGLLVALTVSAFSSANALAQPPTILFVDGSNTGRSVMCEWRARARLSMSSPEVHVFSRASGIDVIDDEKVEPLSIEPMRYDGAPEEYVQRHRGVPINVVDISRSDLVLVVGASHRDRLFDIIDFHCSPDWIAIKKKWNKDPDGVKASTKSWVAMCANTAALKAKIKTIVGCATGRDEDLPDGSEAMMGFANSTDPAAKDAFRNAYNLTARAAIETRVDAIVSAVLAAPTDKTKWCR